MAVRILKPGKLPEEKVYMVTCRHCRCEFEFAAKDAERVVSPDPRDMGLAELRIDCPTCHSAVAMVELRN